MRGIPSRAQWAHFLRNHDELDLGRLTEEQRQQVADKLKEKAAKKPEKDKKREALIQKRKKSR